MATGGARLVKCHTCGIAAAPPTRNIRACMGCRTVGYCSKACQRADWREHKLRCRAAVQPVPTSAAVVHPSPAAEHGIVRLEVKRDGSDGTTAWEDAGQIHLLEKNEADVTIHASAAGSCRTFQPPNTTSKGPSFLKELPKETRTMLGAATSYKYHHSCDGADVNLLLLFHGAGDSPKPYDALGRRMALPQTATLSLSAAAELEQKQGRTRSAGGGSSAFVALPFGMGHTWFAEMDYATGMTLAQDDPRRLASLKRAVDLLYPLLLSLTETWPLERVFLLGYSAGGCLVHELCRRWRNEGHAPLGGAVCIAGGLRNAEERSGTMQPPQRPATDVLIVAGSKDVTYSEEAARVSQRLYQPGKVRVHVQEGKGHAMIGSEEEMRAIMTFFAKRMVRRLVSLEGRCT